MLEICALLARKPTPRKPRKAPVPRIHVGSACFVYGHAGIVVGKHETNANWWNVRVNGRVSGFDRFVIWVVED